MATEVNTAMQNHVMTEFWGGDDRGMCVQITSKNIQLRDTAEEQLRESEGYIQLTMEEALQLRDALTGFIRREAERRKEQNFSGCALRNERCFMKLRNFMKI